MSNLYVTVVVDLDDGQGTRGIGPVTTWPGWDGTATTGVISVPQTLTLTGSPEEAADPPTIRVRASDDPLLQAPLRHYWQEALTNVGGYNPPVYSGAINYADGATQYLSVLRLAALTTDPTPAALLYLTRAEWLAANGYAHPDGTTITQAEDGTLSAVATGTGDLLAANNLSELTATAATARGNIDAASSAALTAEASTRATNDATNATALSTHAALTTTAHGGLVASTDPRLTDTRTPTAHASTHLSTGTDAIAAAVASGASGLLTGADKAKLDGIAAGATANTGTVTSVAATVPSGFSVSGSPITGAGTLAITETTQAANLVKAGPGSGAAATPTYRALVAADLPATVAVTNADNSFTAAQTTTVADAATTTATVTRTGRHTSSGPPAAGFGNAWLERAHNAANTLTDLWQIVGQWTTATNAAESSDLLIQLRNAGAALATVLKVKGTGGFQAQSTNSGGTQPNALGANGVDWQTSRSGASATASGAQATIGGGQNNTAVGQLSTIAGGETNATNAAYSSIGGGGGNQTNAGQATVAGGWFNNASGAYSFVGGGDSNGASGAYSTGAGGYHNAASGGLAAIGGGSTNTASGTYSAIPGGQQAVASLYGQQAHAAGQFSTAGDAQASVLVARLITTDATPGELWLDGSSARLTLATNRAVAYRLLCIARDGSTPDVAAFTATGVLARGAGNVALSGNSVTTLINGAGLTFAPAANTTNQALQLAVTGLSGKTYHWVCRIEMVEVI